MKGTSETTRSRMPYRTLALLTALIAILPVTARTAAGQARQATWLSVGLGLGSGAEAGYALRVSLLHHRERRVYALRAVRLLSPDGPSQGDVGPLVGIGTRPGAAHASAAVGLGLTRVETLTERFQFDESLGHDVLTSHRDASTTVGVQLDIQLFLSALPIGIGTSLFGNLNFKGSFVGIVLTVPLGSTWTESGDRHP